MRAPGVIGCAAVAAGIVLAARPSRECIRMRSSPPVALGADVARLARGAQLVRQGECGRCHQVAALPGIAAAPRARSCSGCHAWIHGTREDQNERDRQSLIYPRWDQYVENVHSYLAVPDLAASGARLDPAWVSRFLRAPYKIRPGLTESMIRTPYSQEDADAIAQWLRSLAPPAQGLAAQAAAIPLSSRAEDVAAGEALYGKLQCARCHAFGDRGAEPGVPEAPDLAHTRARMRAADVATFIVTPSTRMPDYGLGARDAARLRDFIVGAPIARPAAAAAAATADLPLLSRPVRWEEVNTKVFAAICSHCHSDGRLTGGDGGPGNTGGLGYAGAGLDLGSWRGVVRGARHPDGRRISILAAGPRDSEPPLVARLRRRVHEHAAELAGTALPQPGSGRFANPGMPLGQPPLDAERFQLVRSWIAQGAPGPNGHGEKRVSLSRRPPL